MRRLLACPLLFILLSSPPAAAGGDPYAAALRADAARLRLSDDRYWDILLHYKKGIFGRTSLIDDRRFFLSPGGKSDPAAELAATIDGFFESGLGEEASPRCRFPARFAWLTERLGIDASKLPAPSCPTLDNTLKRIDPRSAALIFASGHMNAPASMFGHTLLRIDSSYESPLLSYAVNYAAEIDPSDSGVSYAFKGIFGLYPGYYSILPYYDKVKEYHGMDQRDLWEYRLNLAQEDVRRMVLHVMELQGIYSDYFFFGENCSYNLLFLLEAAAPSARLTERFRGWTVPADTVKAALSEGLLSPPVYRPSQARKIRHVAAALDDDGIARAVAVIDGREAAAKTAADAIPEEKKARILDLASEAIQMRYMKRQLEKAEFQKRFLDVLSARSRFGEAAGELPPIPVPERPDEGHGSARASLAAGVRKGAFFVETAVRPAYHDLLDADGGYTAGSQIDFLNAAARYYPKDDRFRLHRLDLVHIVSLAGRDAFFRPVSWKVYAGIMDKPFPETPGSAVAVLSPGGGFAWASDVLGLAYGLVETELDVSDRYGKGYAAGVGASAGLIRQVGRSWKISLQARQIFAVAGDTRRGNGFSAWARNGFRLGRNWAFFADGGWEDSGGVRLGEGKLSVSRYF